MFIRAAMSTLSMNSYTVNHGDTPYQLVKITPPQTTDDNISVGKGAYCFVIDVSGR